MILITLKPWQAIEGITHTRTIWEVADSESFLNILETVESRDMLESYFSNIFVPVGATYYVRATRVFSNGTRSTLNPIPTTNYGSSKESILLADDPIVEIPFVYVSQDDILSNKTNLDITTSEFRCNADDHAYTHWIVMDGNNEILYCNLYDKVNRTSISIPNNYVFKNKSQLSFIAIHGSNTGVESPAGRKIIDFVSDFNFEINSGISWIEPLKDFKIVFTAIDKDKPMNLFKVELLDYSTEAVVFIPSRSGDTFVIPWIYLKEGMTYKLAIYAYDKNLMYGKIYKELKVANLVNTVVRDPNFTYINKIEEADSYNSRLPNNPMHSEALYNMRLLVPMLDKSVEIWDSDDIKLKDSLGVAEGLKLLSSTPEYTLIKPISKGLILVDTPNANGVPTFMVYSYSNHDETFKLEHTLERSDETTCLGKTNNIIQITSTEFIYLPVNSGKFKIYDIENNKTKDLLEIPLDDSATDISKAIIIRMDDNAVLIANIGTYKTKIYNYESNTFKDGITFGPNSFVNADLRTIPMFNGNTMIVKTNKVENDNDTALVIYNYKNTSFDKPEIRYDSGLYPEITAICGYGHIHMANFVQGDPKKKIEDKFVTKVYV